MPRHSFGVHMRGASLKLRCEVLLEVCTLLDRFSCLSTSQDASLSQTCGASSSGPIHVAESFVRDFVLARGREAVKQSEQL